MAEQVSACFAWSIFCHVRTVGVKHYFGGMLIQKALVFLDLVEMLAKVRLLALNVDTSSSPFHQREASSWFKTSSAPVN